MVPADSVGRGCDMPTVRRIVREVAAENNAFSSVVLGILPSVQFSLQRIRSPELEPDRVGLSNAD
jgi:hypothetical protein